MIYLVRQSSPRYESFMAGKLYLKSQDLLDDSIRLAAHVLRDGFCPNVIIALWRGGTPIGIAVQEFLDYYGNTTTNSIALRTSSYEGSGERRKTVDIYGMSWLLKNIEHQDKVLIVDDVFDTGKTIEAVINEFRTRARKNAPHDIRIAVPWYKPEANLTAREPDYYLYTTDKWLHYPYSIEGLSRAEIRDNIPAVYEIIRDMI